MSRLSPVDLAGVRQFVRPELSALPAEDLEQVIEDSLSGLPSDTTEDFMSMLSSFGKAAGPTMQRAAPGMISGATTGASVGGPWGALIGAGVGLASSAVRKPGGAPAPSGPASAAPTATARPAAPPVGVPSAIPSVPTPEPSGAPALPTGQGAAATLTGLLQNPTVQQALLSQVLGSAGGEQVQIGSGASVPRGAINSLLAQLLSNASEGLPESESISEQSYLLGESGEYLVDPASPEQQAALVLSRLRSVRPQRLPYESGDFFEVVEWMSESADSESAEWLEADDSAEIVEFY